MSQNEPFNPLSMSANKHFTVRETYTITRKAARSIPHLKQFQAAYGKHFPERIMLAVTEVNGCALCAYAHTKMALEVGMDTNEVRQLLGGVTEDAPDFELPAIGFAQHYADSGAEPEKEAWNRLVEIYGAKAAFGILAATRVMMWGNAVGIPLSSLRARRNGDPHPRSSLRYELGTILGTIAVTPFALLHAAASMISRKPLTPVSA